MPTGMDREAKSKQRKVRIQGFSEVPIVEAIVITDNAIHTDAIQA